MGVAIVAYLRAEAKHNEYPRDLRQLADKLEVYLKNEFMRRLGARLAVLAFLVTVGGTLALSQLYGLVVYGISDALWARRQKRRSRA